LAREGVPTVKADEFYWTISISVKQIFIFVSRLKMFEKTRFFAAFIHAQKRTTRLRFGPTASDTPPLTDFDQCPLKGVA